MSALHHGACYRRLSDVPCSHGWPGTRGPDGHHRRAVVRDIEQSFIALADAMPAESYGFKPTDGAFKDVRTFGEQVKHVACSNFAFFNEIEKKEPPAACGTGGPHPATTKTELMAYLRESFAYARHVLRTMTPANALEPAGGPYGGMSTRLGLTTLAVWHASDHYGQLVVYLRMSGIVPPASQPRAGRARVSPSRQCFGMGARPAS